MNLILFIIHILLYNWFSFKCILFVVIKICQLIVATFYSRNVLNMNFFYLASVSPYGVFTFMFLSRMFSLLYFHYNVNIFSSFILRRYKWHEIFRNYYNKIKNRNTSISCTVYLNSLNIWLPTTQCHLVAASFWNPEPCNIPLSNNVDRYSVVQLVYVPSLDLRVKWTRQNPTDRCSMATSTIHFQPACLQNALEDYFGSIRFPRSATFSICLLVMKISEDKERAGKSAQISGTPVIF